jgi:plastocyanin
LTTQKAQQDRQAIARPGTRERIPQVAGLVLRLLVAAGLAVDAYVHADLAPLYAGIHASISQGDLFRIEAGVSAAAALIVLVVGRRTGFGLAFVVSASALGAILLYRYVNVGQLGPLPNMYEPSWFGEKTLAAVAEAAAVVLSAGGLLWQIRHRQPARGGRLIGSLAMAAGLLAGLAVAGFTGHGTSAPASPPASAAAGGQQTTIVGNNSLRFAPMKIHLHTGKVRITLKDSGAYPHNIVIPALHVTSPTVTGDPGGLQTSFMVTFAHPGSYRFYCQYHVSAGMTGTFVVS